MIGKSFPEYIFIRLSISALCLIAPAAFVYLAFSWWQGTFILSPWLGLYALTEAVFYGFFTLRERSLQKARQFTLAAVNHPLPLNRAQRRELFKNCAKNSLQIPNYPSGWFTSSQSLQRENVVDWILWALFSVRPNDLQPEWQEEIDDYISVIENVTKKKFEPGHNPTVHCRRLTFDPVQVVHRPLLWYLIVALVDSFSSFCLFLYGFEHYSSPRWFEIFPPRPITAILSHQSPDLAVPFWYRPHRSKTKLPVLFLHGIGIGLLPYIPFFADIIAQDPDVGIVAIEVLPISMRISRPPLPREEMCQAIARILTSLDLPRIVLVSHSYGTILTAQILSSFLRQRVAATMMIDPIPFLLHAPDVAYNFVYRKPRFANEWQVWYFASRDPDISRALSRHFFWADNIMWKEEIDGLKAAIVLSGEDSIVPAEQVRLYLTNEEKRSDYWRKDNLEVLFFDGLDHANVFDIKATRKLLAQVLSRFVREE